MPGNTAVAANRFSIGPVFSLPPSAIDMIRIKGVNATRTVDCIGYSATKRLSLHTCLVRLFTDVRSCPLGIYLVLQGRFGLSTWVRGVAQADRR